MAISLGVVVNFLGLVLSTWLGIYIVMHNRRSWIAWLSGLTLWALAGLFANLMLYLYATAPGFQPFWVRLIFPVWPQQNPALTILEWSQGWAAIFAIVFWYHTSVLLIPGNPVGWRRWSVVVCYSMGILAPILQSRTPFLFTIQNADQLLTDTLRTGPLFPFFALAMLVFPALAVLNLLQAKRMSDSFIVKRQLDTLIATSLTACLIVAVTIISSIEGYSIPMIWVSLLTVIMVGILCYGVTRYSALLGSRILRRDLAYSALTIGLVVLVYLGMFWWLYKSYYTPPGVVVFLIPLVILTHSLIEESRQVLERFVYDRRTRQLRSGLRELNRLAGEQADLGGLISSSLVTISASVRATSAVVLVFEEELAQPVGGYHWRECGIPVSRQDLLADDPVHLNPSHPADGLCEAALLIPLYSSNVQIGALLLGRPENGVNYSSEDLVFLQDPSERIAELITQNKRIAIYLEQFTQIPLKDANLASDLIPTQWVEDALQNLYDYAYLGDNPLVSLKQVQALLLHPNVTHLDRGRAVYQVISSAVDKLRPSDTLPKNPVPREWFPYIILHDAYFEGLPNRDIILKLYISEGTFHRTRRSALRSVARVLSEIETSVN